jgi:hypothetical protein
MIYIGASLIDVLNVSEILLWPDWKTAFPNRKNIGEL